MSFVKFQKTVIKTFRISWLGCSVGTGNCVFVHFPVANWDFCRHQIHHGDQSGTVSKFVFGLMDAGESRTQNQFNQRFKLGAAAASVWLSRTITVRTGLAGCCWAELVGCGGWMAAPHHRRLYIAAVVHRHFPLSQTQTAQLSVCRVHAHVHTSVIRVKPAGAAAADDQNH